MREAGSREVRGVGERVGGRLARLLGEKWKRRRARREVRTKECETMSSKPSTCARLNEVFVVGRRTREDAAFRTKIRRRCETASPRRAGRRSDYPGGGIRYVSSESSLEG